MTPLPWCPQFDVDDFTFALDYPVTRWIPGRRSAGVAQRDAEGAPGNEVQLRRSTLGLNLRFNDDQWPSVRTFIQLVQNGRSFIWWPRALMVVPDMPESFTVKLESPRVRDAVRPTRDAQMIRLLSLPIVLASSDVMHAYYFPVT